MAAHGIQGEGIPRPGVVGGRVPRPLGARCWTIFSGRFLVPPPESVLAGIWSDRSLYQGVAPTTIHEAALGFLWGNLAAILVALLFLLAPITEKLGMRLAVVSYCLPVVAIAPILQILLPDESPKIGLAAISVFFTTLIIVLTGLRSADPAEPRPHQGLRRRLAEDTPQSADPDCAPASLPGSPAGGPDGPLGSDHRGVPRWDPGSGHLDDDRPSRPERPAHVGADRGEQRHRGNRLRGDRPARAEPDAVVRRGRDERGRRHGGDARQRRSVLRRWRRCRQSSQAGRVHRYAAAVDSTGARSVGSGAQAVRARQLRRQRPYRRLGLSLRRPDGGAEPLAHTQRSVDDAARRRLRSRGGLCRRLRARVRSSSYSPEWRATSSVGA